MKVREFALLADRQVGMSGADSARAARETVDGPARGPMLAVDHVRIDYRVDNTLVHAVDDASFDVMPEEKVMLIGPSGCGKSTLLKAVAGFIVPVAGRITFAGRADMSPGPDRAVVFQEFDQLFPWRTVLDNVAYPLRVTGRSKRDALEEASHFVDMVGLGAAVKRYPHQLSGGMKQRVAIARALALGPRMLLMDEPFGSLDAITRARLQGDLLRLTERVRVTLLFVTHSIEEALLLGDWVVVLKGAPSQVAATKDVRGLGTPGDQAYLDMYQELQRLLGGSGKGEGHDDD